ncbi:MAG: sulfite exporter TauE/SafE family protein [Candidatus Heimdallarchaeaceae archaeon]
MLFEFFPWWAYLALFAAGLLSGAVSPTFGIGGGLLNVPILLIAFKWLLLPKIDFDENLLGATATATSLGVIIFTALSGSISYIREKRIDYSLAFRFMIFAIPGAISGAFFSQWLKSQDVNKDIFQIIFGATMISIAMYKFATIFIAWNKKRKGWIPEDEECLEEDCDQEQMQRPWWKRTVFYRNFEDKRGVKFNYRAKLIPGIFIAIVGGFVGATLGLGGGVIYVPILTMAIGVPAGIATATSTFIILFATPFAVLIRSFDIFGPNTFAVASIQWDIVFLMAAGAIITANIVPRFLHKIKSEIILAGFWTLATFAAFRVLLKALDIIDW